MREPEDILRAAGLDADKLELLDYLLEEEGLEDAAASGVISTVERAPAPSLSHEPQQSPLSYAQQRLWFLDQFEPGRAAYNIAGALRMAGRLDAAALGSSLNEIVRRHESLRTSFTSVGGAPVQVIAPASHLALAVEELTALPAGEREAEVRRLAREEAARPFDLRESPLVRARLLRLGAEEHVLLLTMHHIVSDGWSLGVFARELAALYGAFTEGRPSPLQELSLQYADYAAWQRERLTGEFLDTQLDYWRRQLSGDRPALELTAGRPRPGARSFRGATHTFGLPVGLREQLKALAREEDATLFMALVGAFKALLWRYTGQPDVAVGTPVAGRTRAEVEPLIGCFVNTLVLRTRLDAGQSFRELLRRVRETALGAYAHQEVPFERVVEELHPERSLDQSPLFQVVFTLQNAPMPPLELPGLKLSLMDVDDETARFDLSLEVVETPDGLRGMLHYDVGLFDAAAVARMAAHLQTLLEGAVAGPDTPVSLLPVLTEVELRRLLSEWNATAAVYPRDSSVHELFEAQAGETPEATALVFGEEQLTYAELNRRANQLACHLKGLGVGPEVRVGIMLERSPEMVVGLLGILKAGGAYVPLDPTYPHERLAFMIDDASVTILLTRERHLDAAFAPLVVCLDADWPAIAAGGADDPPPAGGAEHMAYVMYTSGSTGVPKGVCVTHRAVARLVKRANYTDLSRDDTILQLAPLGFDASTVEIWGALLNGACLVLLPQEDSASLEEIGAHVRRHRVTKLWLTAGLFHLMVDYRLEDLRGVRQILAGGDVLSPPHVERVVRELVGCRMTNCYGPTENTTFTTYHDVAPEECAGSVPIGRPISNTRVYVLDERLWPVPVGVVGELYTGGDGLARGYLNQPGLTAEKFIPDPFGDEPGARLYRTGDLARHRADGVIEFVGRGDQQVKVRGYRIELEEIKSALGKHPAARECLVVTREDAPGDKRIVAYLIAAREEQPSAAELRHFLRETLPEYMVPSAFVWLEEFPLTANAKIDREALPAPEHPVGERQNDYTPPRTPAEEALTGIWADVLGVERIGVYDNFFELGGHSLLATQVVTRLRESLRAEVSLRQFFESPVIAELASLIEPLMAGGGTPSPMLRVPRGRALPLSFAQQRLWFLDQFEPGNPIYNVPIVLRLRGPLDLSALERTLNEVVRRHESLRTVFRMERGEPMQVILPKQPIAVPVLNLAALAHAEGELERLAAEEAQKGFDLSRGPLLRATLLRLATDEHALLFTMHHIVSDGWSIGVLVREVAAVYSAYVRGQESPLPELTLQYADYAVWQREWLRGEVLEEQLAYWRRQLEPLPPALELPTDRPRPEVLSHRGAILNVNFPAGLTGKLKELSRREGATLYMTLLAAFQTLLHRYTSRDDIAVGGPIANRQRSEIEPLIGFFVNTLVLRTDLSGDPSFRALLGRVQEVTLGAYAHQDVPFEMLVEELQPERSLGLTPFFQVAFALQNAPGEELKLPGLTLTRVDVQSRTARFDLSLLLEESAEGLVGLVEYSADLFDERTIRRLLEHFRILLDAVVADPDERLSALPLLAAAEARQLITRWSEVAVETGSGCCVHELFERQAEARPDDAALVFGERLFTYGELNRRANQLAHRLRRLGVGPEAVVAVLTERPVEAVLGALAVLKAGGAYLPLDPADPRERLAFMLCDATTRVVLTQKHLETLLPEDFGVVCYTDADGETVAQVEEENPAVRVTPDGLACLTYTSGSAGRPKAVGVDHRALVGMIRAVTPDAGRPAPRTLQLAPFVQEIAAQEIFSTLCAGGALVLAPEEARKDSRELWRFLAGAKIERLLLTPARLRLLAEAAGAEDEAPSDLRLIISAGEQLRITGPVRAMFGRLPWCLLEVSYGQPETQLAALWRPRGRAGEWPSVAPLGGPAGGTQLFVLDSRLRPVPAGAVGELYVGGAGVARGHLNQPGETALDFIPHPFSASPGARLYGTGDLVRHTDDGRLEYAGRADNRVTVRGFRVELEEVEAALGLYPAVRRAVVKPWEDEAGRRQLAAYVLNGREASPTAAELRGYLREKLPAYMIPSTFMLLKAFPLTRGGEVDRRQLPAPDAEGGEVKEGHVAPRTLTEEVLAGIWAGLLKVERVGVNDNFFDLGGHSLLATQLVSGVRETFRVEIPLRRLFESPTVAGLAESIDEALRDGQGTQSQPITPRARDGHLPLSFAQQRLWFIHQLEPDNATYHIATAVNVNGPLDVSALGRSLTEIVRRHEVLRTSFAVTEGRPVQVVSPDAAFNLPVIDLSDRTETEKEEERQRLAREEASLPFDLERGPLVRARLLRLSDEAHVLLLAMHHIVSDGWSVGVMVRELAALYEAYATGAESPLQELTVQYADYAAWQRERLAGEFIERQLDYWRGQLAGAPPMLELPTARPRRVVQTFRGANAPLELSTELTARLKALSSGEGVTLFMTLAGAFHALLWRYTGQRDILVGTPIANRTRAEVESLIGFFVNTLVLRARPSAGQTFRELLREVRETALGAYAHQEVPFERVVEELHPERTLSHTPLFQVMFALQNAPAAALKLANLKLDLVEIPSETARFDLTLSLLEEGGRLSGQLEYNSDLFDADAVTGMLEHYRHLLEGVVEDPGARLSELELLTEAERRRQLVEWNDTARGAGSPSCAHHLFEQRAAAQPETTALVFGDERLTYGELNRRANQLAHYLRRFGVRAETPVCVCFERSVELVVATLAVVKAGGAYVPLDPSNPAERLSFMLKDSGAPFLLTREALRGLFDAGGTEVVSLDREWAAVALESGDDPEGGAAPDNLAYVVYTSGSTGVPKGVEVAHASLANLTRWYQRTSAVEPGEKATQLSGVGFDATVFELWPNLIAGASLHLPDEETRLSPERLRDWLVANEIAVCFAATPLAEQLLALPWPQDAALRVLHTGGDKLHRFPDESLPFDVVNNYGPSESTVLATSGRVGPGGGGVTQSPTIGRPMDNAEVYLLDEGLCPVPVGVRGELYIGGGCLARGYLKRPALTAERFIPHPFSASPGARLYRTGDLGRFLPDGQIEFLGRLDHQIKIRGHRIELGEIEAVLAGHRAVREGVVECREARHGEKRLAAYVAAREGERPTVEELRGYLAERLPGYMVPSAFVFLERLPHNANGKVDRQALPDADAEALARDAVYVEPGTEMERTVAGLWRELLGLEKVGLHDNFFDLGGHSLLVVRMQGRLREILQREITVAEMFKYPTVSTLAWHLSRGPQDEPNGAETHRRRAAARREAIEGRARRARSRESVNGE